MAGNQCYSSWDHTYEQMLPTVTWGNNYTALPFKNNPAGYYLKVVAAENNSRVFVNGTYYKTLKQAEYFEYMLYKDTITTITCTNRISVAQFTKGYGCAKNPNNPYNGDPSQMMLFPDEQYGTAATVNTVSQNNWWWWNWNWWKPENYINIMVKNGDTSSFTLNNKKLPVSSWSTFGSPARHFAQVKIDSGSHYMNSTKGFLAYVYGYSYVEGYAYSAAARFKAIQNNFIITNAQCRKDKVSFTAIPNDSFANFTWKFGDGSKASGATVKHKYKDTGWYSVKMYTSHIRTGVKDSVTKDLYVADTKIKSLFNKDTSICGPINMVVISKGFNVDNIYKWNDGHSVYYRAVKNPGILWLEVTERNGCVFRDSLKVTGHNMPKANFSVSNPTFCLNRSKNIVFKNLSVSKDSISEYAWDFGEKTITSFDSVLNYQYKKANTYAVILKATTKYGCYHDTFQIVDVLPSPKADFSFSKKDTCFNTNVILLKNNTVLDINEHKRYKWYFSEGYNLSNNNPSSRTYSSAGTYQIFLIYENNNKCIDTMVKTLKIYDNPKASFSILSNSICTKDSMKFKNTSTSIYKPIKYEWNWGDSTQNLVTTDTLPKHPYKKYGFYKISLIATSPQGCTDTARRSVVPDETPFVKFLVNKDTQCFNNHAFNFTNVSALKTGVMSFSWNLGDGNSSTDSNVLNKSFAKDSTYQIKLIATSLVGCKAEFSRSIVVGGYPKSKLTLNKAQQCYRNNSFSFNNISSIAKGSILKYYWTFGNGDKSTLKDIANYHYSTEDTFKISLESISNFGCADTTYTLATTFAQPIAKFTINSAVQCFNGHLFKYTNASDIKYGALTYQWKLGDNTIATDTNIVKKYTTNGLYAVSLISSSNNGCKDTISQTVTINASPKTKFVINKTKQCFRNNNYNFINNSTINAGSIKTFRWDLGDAYTTNLSSVFNYHYNREDTFNVSLVASSDAGCLDTFKTTAITFAQPKAVFAVNASVQCFNQQNFKFTNQSILKYGAITYSWKLGDGSTSSDTNIFKKYITDSVYNVRLIANTANACADTTTQTITLFESPKICLQHF